MMMKRLVAESYALTDDMYGAADAVGSEKWKDHLKGFPMDQGKKRKRYVREMQQDPKFKIRVAFISGGINSKAVMFLAHDFFRYYDKSKFEVHVFSTSLPDKPLFIQHTMRGVDWRQRVMDNADFFHDAKDIRDAGPAELARFVASFDIHILVDWDGYCRNGIRPQGLYALRPAPVQIMHQEFLGTSGGNFDYLITDRRVSPPRLQKYYSEKFIYMPHHFFSKGHAVQDDVPPPAVQYEPKPRKKKYKLGTGSPQENACLAPDKHDNVKFVFCNFNKFLKFSPTTMRTWLRIVDNTPDSLLCLLSYPKEGIPNVYKFVKSYKPHLTKRVHFVPWENNPFDHIVRNGDFCNLVLDTHPYNGHTTTMDALYAGVPVVTRSDGQDMASRVTTSANIVLGLDQYLNAMGWNDYADKAIAIANNQTLFASVREALIASALQTNPMHPFWDMKRYVKNLQKGFQKAWQFYIDGEEFENIDVLDDEDERVKKEGGDGSIGWKVTNEAIELKYENHDVDQDEGERGDVKFEEWEWETGDEL
mmetsp:Transcript_57887/g.69032  ORF Transcript_57887/g.69032 Transcript_57887/m.69032 type:complete len:533 (+) Transcript_57887:1-1599(+)